MFDCTQWSFAYGKPLTTGSIKNSPEDFKVNEILGFELTGEGEHLFLLIEKRGLNTEELAKALARRTNRPYKDISCAGIKDRHALTTQWFSIHCPGEEIADADSLEGDGWRVLSSKRHLKKLKTGALSGNFFQLIIRDIHGVEEIEARLQKIKQCGVPNYFGTQRFGFDGQNLLQAQRLLLGEIMVKNRFLRGIYYSSMRSFLFNQILSERITHLSWNKAISGDVMQLAGKNSIFSITSPDGLIDARLQAFDISPAAPLWGVGKELATDLALTLVKKVLTGYESLCEALEQHKLERAYRAQVLQVNEMTWEWQEGALLLHFRLPVGGYATSVVREVFDLR